MGSFKCVNLQTIQGNLWAWHVLILIELRCMAVCVWTTATAPCSSAASLSTRLYSFLSCTFHIIHWLYNSNKRSNCNCKPELSNYIITKSAKQSRHFGLSNSLLAVAVVSIGSIKVTSLVYINFYRLFSRIAYRHINVNWPSQLLKWSSI